MTQITILRCLKLEIDPKLSNEQGFSLKSTAYKCFFPNLDLEGKIWAYRSVQKCLNGSLLRAR